MSLNGHIANREVIGMESEHLFEYLTKQRGISVPELRKLISIRIESGILSDNPLEKSQWERIPHKGQIPTPDEWLQYVIATLKKRRAGSFSAVALENDPVLKIDIMEPTQWKCCLHSRRKCLHRP